MLTASGCANRRSGYRCRALRVRCVYCLFNREASALGLLFLLLLLMSAYVIRSAGLDGWHYVGSLRTELCPTSKPAKLPAKQQNRRNAERLCSLRGRILGSQFVTPKLEKVNTVFVLGDDF